MRGIKGKRLGDGKSPIIRIAGRGSDEVSDHADLACDNFFRWGTLSPADGVPFVSGSTEVQSK